MIGRSKLSPFQWLALVQHIPSLVAAVVEALRDGRLDEAEVKRIGDEFVALIVAAVSG